MRRRTLFWLAPPFALVVGALGLALAASGGPHDPFERYAPEVDAAVASLNAGRYDEANERLTRYLRLQGCHEGVLQTPPGAIALPDAAFDLGLGLFGAAEILGQRFADVDDAPPPGGEGDQAKPSPPERRSSIDCARMLLGALLERRLPADLEARARFLRGNAAFLERRWDESLADYDRALRLAPGSDADKDDALGRDLAWNRALALRNREREREREREKQGQGGQGGQNGQGGSPNEKSGQGGSPDQGQKSPDKSDDSKSDPSQDKGQSGQGGQGGQGGSGNEDQGKSGQGGSPNEAPQGAGGQGQGDPQAQNGAPRAPNNQDEHMLDQFEQAPTWQREEGKARGAGRRLRGVADK